MAAPEIEFSVNIGKPQLVRPAAPTPQELKYLSNIDDQVSLRHHVPFVHVFPPRIDYGTVSSSCSRDDPVAVIKMALSKALVYYYPIAGRLRNAEKGKLVVDCCGEGAIFREADADITLEKLQKKMKGGLKPPFPQWELLLVDDVWGSKFITDSALLRMQVTRLACGGFVLAYTLNHCICDTYGAFQFITAVSEFSKDPCRTTPCTIPSWDREALKPRSPPIISFSHHEFNTDHPFEPDNFTETAFKSFQETSVFLSNAEVAALKHQVNDKNILTFDVIASCLWRARSRILCKPDEITKLVFLIDTRFRCKPPLSKGYYGSTMVASCVAAKASELIEKPLNYTAFLVSEAKRIAFEDDEYRASSLDFIELNRHGMYCQEGASIVSDIRWFKFVDLDFGWGQAVYAGLARAGIGIMPGMLTFVISHKNEDGVQGLLILASVPASKVSRFHEEVRKEIVGGLSSL